MLKFWGICNECTTDQALAVDATANWPFACPHGVTAGEIVKHSRKITSATAAPYSGVSGNGAAIVSAARYAGVDLEGVLRERALALRDVIRESEAQKPVD